MAVVGHMIFTPSSFGSVREHNSCHAPAGTPAGGQFCSGESSRDAALQAHMQRLEEGTPGLKELAERIRQEATTPLETRMAPLIAYGELVNQRYLDTHGTTADRFSTFGVYEESRAGLHEVILREMLESKPTHVEKPVAVILGGMTGAGKTSSVAADLKTDDKVLINSDNIKERLPEYAGENASILHEESSHLADRAFHLALSRRQHIVLDSTMRTLGGVDYESATDGAGIAWRIKQLKNAGYRIEVRFVDVDVETSVTRMLQRYGRAKAEGKLARYVPVKYIKANYDATYGTIPRRTFEAIKPHVDAYLLVDNRGAKRKVLASKGRLTS